LHAGRADLVVAVVDPWSGMPAIEEAGLVVCNKIDRGPPPPGTVGVSALTGAGLAALADLLSEQARSLTARSGAAPLTRARHRVGVGDAAAHLSAAAQAHWAELRGEELRLAMRALGQLTGTVGVEDLLDTVFGQFCIGK